MIVNNNIKIMLPSKYAVMDDQAPSIVSYRVTKAVSE